MRNKGDTGAGVEWAVARIAARQYGVVSTPQLLAAGLTRSGIARRIAAGRLHPVHRGAYAVGHRRLSAEGRWWAAILACETEASQPVLSHRSAAELWRLLPSTGGAAQVSILGTGGRRRQAGIHLHRSRTLTAETTTRQRGIPTTTPARTIADLRLAARTRGCPATVSAWELRRAIRQAEVLGLATGAEALVERTRSDLERAFLRLCRRHGLPRPAVNVRIDALEVDFLWPERRLIVETDGYRYHRGRSAFEADRARDLRLRTLGYEVIRLSDRQVAREPEQVAAVLAASLSESRERGGASAPPRHPSRSGRSG